MEAQRTQGDWDYTVNSSSISIYSEKHDCDLATISLTHKGYENDEAEANAEFICKAVNSHDALVEALDELIKAATNTTKNIVAFEGAQELDSAIDKAKEVVKKAKQ
jgi:hypothetical protein